MEDKRRAKRIGVARDVALALVDERAGEVPKVTCPGAYVAVGFHCSWTWLRRIWRIWIVGSIRCRVAFHHCSYKVVYNGLFVRDYPATGR